MCNTLQLFGLSNKEEMPSPTDITVVASAGWSPSCKKTLQETGKKTCSEGGIRTLVVSLFSVLCHMRYRTQRGLFKNKVWYEQPSLLQLKEKFKKF